jgi:hypothetical protein
MNDLNSTPDFVLIPLTQNQNAMVSLEDADILKMRWYAYFDKTYGDGGRFHARRNRAEKYNEIGRGCVLMHRFILQRMIGRELTTGEHTDHINGDTLDNRRANLRLANRFENSRNKPKRKHNKSGYKGVTLQRGLWFATIRVNGKNKVLGKFNTPEEAYAAYCEGAKKYHGEFANVK